MSLPDDEHIIRVQGRVSTDNAGLLSNSRAEEVIFLLTLIASILAFGHGFKIAGFILLAKAGWDLACTICCAWVEWKEEDKDKP